MNWKEFFKPTTLKIVLFFILLIITIFIPKTATQCNMAPNGLVCIDSSVVGIGYPIFFGEKFSGDARTFGIYPLNLIINLVVGYLIACLIVFLLTNSKNKTSTK